VIQVDALGPSGAYRTRKRLPLLDISARLMGEMSIVPPLFIYRSMAAQRAARVLRADSRASALARAGDAFATATIAGLAPGEYQHAVSRISGLPITSVRQATQALAQSARRAYESAVHGLPFGAVCDWRDPRTIGDGHATWTRRGDVLSIHAAGNHPGVHSLWLQAVALGFKVAVRPSQREPLTPYRLISALLDAGFPSDNLSFLPTDHSGADRIVGNADLSIVYGGDEVIRKYATTTTVLAQGPGRSKLLLTRDSGWQGCLDTVIDSIAGEGGSTCLNATAVYVEGDPSLVAEAVAERLSALPSLPPEDEKAVLPVRNAAAAASLDRYLLDRRGDARPWLGGEGVTEDLGDGTAVLRPAVFQLDSATAPQTGIELPFPCIWVAPWTPDDGLLPLRKTLVLTAFTRDEELIERLIDEPTISNVYIGDHPTSLPRHTMPHDSYLSEFLMRTKSVIRT
jgi:acyl-CoA reductase-like NAD-dependent aldehyde dehydrogenase